MRNSPRQGGGEGVANSRDLVSGGQSSLDSAGTPCSPRNIGAGREEKNHRSIVSFCVLELF